MTLVTAVLLPEVRKIMEEEAGVMERLVEVVVGAEGLLEVVRVATIIASTAFLLLSFATNLYIIINICYKKRIQVSESGQFSE